MQVGEVVTPLQRRVKSLICFYFLYFLFEIFFRFFYCSFIFFSFRFLVVVVLG